MTAKDELHTDDTRDLDSGGTRVMLPQLLDRCTQYLLSPQYFVIKNNVFAQIL